MTVWPGCCCEGVRAAWHFVPVPFGLKTLAVRCIAAGLSPELQSLEQLRKIPRPTEIPDAGLLCDLLWSDPEAGIKGWGESDRGVSFVFGEDVVTKFLARTDLDLVCRAHQVVEVRRAMSPVQARTRERGHGRVDRSVEAETVGQLGRAKAGRQTESGDGSLHVSGELHNSVQLQG